MKTTMHFNHTHEHHTIDASGQILGRFATNIANLLRGKNKPTFSHHIDCGDFVTVLNSDKISVTGNKLNQKMYRHHTGYIGHLKEISLGDYLQKNHTAVVRLAVLGMLPNNRLRSIWIKRLRFNQSGVENKESQ